MEVTLAVLIIHFRSHQPLECIYTIFTPAIPVYKLHCLIMSVEFPNKFVILALGITRQQFHRGVKVIQTLLAMFKIDRCY